jgi:hypothetical protein
LLIFTEFPKNQWDQPPLIFWRQLIFQTLEPIQFLKKTGGGFWILVLVMVSQIWGGQQLF